MKLARTLWAGATAGAWLTERRAIHYPLLVILATGIAAAWLVWFSGAAPKNYTLGGDFLCYWTAARLAGEGRAVDVYNAGILVALEREIAGNPETAFPFYYPPTYLLFIYPLGWAASQGWGMALGMGLTGAGYLAALWRACPGWRTVWIGAASPMTLVVLANGQNGFLSAALLGGGVGLLFTRPILAGVLLGAMTYKPHLGILVPIALIAARQWQAFAAAAATALALAGIATIWFGADIWPAFVASAFQATGHVDSGLLPNWKVQSFFAAARVAGLPIGVAQAVQAVATVLAAGLVAWVWSRPVAWRLKAALLLLAAPIAAPYAMDYDYAVAAVGLAFWAQHGLDRGFSSHEKTYMGALWVFPLFARFTAKLVHVVPLPWLLAGALLLAVRRIREDLRP